MSTDNSLKKHDHTCEQLQHSCSQTTHLKQEIGVASLCWKLSLPCLPPVSPVEGSRPPHEGVESLKHGGHYLPYDHPSRVVHIGVPGGVHLEAQQQCLGEGGREKIDPSLISWTLWNQSLPFNVLAKELIK